MAFGIEALVTTYSGPQLPLDLCHPPRWDYPPSPGPLLEPVRARRAVLWVLETAQPSLG